MYEGTHSVYKMKKIFISVSITIFTSIIPLYSQQYVPEFEDFIGSFINANLDYLIVSNEIIRTVLTSKELESMYKEGITNFTPAEINNIKSDPNKIFEYTTNESLILMGGTVLAVFETVKTQYNLNMSLLDKFQKRLSFLAGSGNNYGMIIPMRTPLFSLAWI